MPLCLQEGGLSNKRLDQDLIPVQKAVYKLVSKEHCASASAHHAATHRLLPSRVANSLRGYAALRMLESHVAMLPCNVVSVCASL